VVAAPTRPRRHSAMTGTSGATDGLGTLSLEETPQAHEDANPKYDEHNDNHPVFCAHCFVSSVNSRTSLARAAW
jgi:hypothetical protein